MRTEKCLLVFSVLCLLRHSVAFHVLSPSSSLGSRSRPNTSLCGKKKAAGGTSSKKMQVKLLKHVAGTGKAGDILMVTPAFFSNKLRPTQSAIAISDEEVEQEKAEAEHVAQELISEAIEVKEKLQSTKVVLQRKAGPDGQLFGGVGAKTIMDELKKITGSDYFDQKKAKITSMLDEDGKKKRGDIKKLGTYAAKVALMKDVDAKVDIVIEAEP